MFLCAFVGPPDAERSNTAPRVMLTSVKLLVVSHNVKGQKMFCSSQGLFKIHLCMHTEENLLCSS